MAGCVGVHSGNGVTQSVKILSLDLGAQVHGHPYLWPQPHRIGRNSSFSLYFHGISTGKLLSLCFLHCIAKTKLKGGPPEDRCPSALAFRTTVRPCSLKLTWDRSEKMCQVHKNTNIRIAGTVVCNLKKNKQTKPNKRKTKKKILIRSSILIAYNYRKHNYTQTYTYILHYITM